MNWLYYLFEANLYLILFYALYYLLLRRETWHQYNRAYLLGSSALAFIIPVLQLGFLKPVPVTELLPQLVTHYSYVTPAKIAPAAQAAWTINDTLLATYFGIALCLLIGLTIKITRLIVLSRKGTARDFGKWKVITTNTERGAFTFFNYLFVSADMAGSETVITHELVHIRQKHTWDIIYLEIFRIINWFNPIAYLLQRSMKELHEFVADEANAGSKEQINAYTDFLIANAYGAYEHPLTNNLFNQSLLKKRIMMLHQKRSGSSARLKYLLVLPLLGGALCASTLAFAKDYGIDIAPGHKLSANLISHTSNAAKVKRLIVVQGSIGAITNKVSVRESKTKTSIFTVQNLTPADRQHLLKKYNIKIAVIETDSPVDREEINFPITVKADKLAGIPLLSKGAIGFIIDPSSYNFKSLTDMSLKFSKKGYKMDFDEYKDKDNTRMLKLSLRKADAEPGSGSSSTFRIDEMKTGYAIFIGVDAAKNLLYVRSHKFVFLKKDTSLIRRKTDSAIKGTNKEIRGAVKSQIDQQIQKASIKFPPPSVSNFKFAPLAAHLVKYTRYPAKELEQRITGNVVIEVTLNNDHKISDVKVTNDARPVFANEVIRAAKLYADAINSVPGTYIMLVQFNLQSEKGDKRYLPDNLNPILEKKKNFAGNVELSGFFTE
jgi:hypothetical protein